MVLPSSKYINTTVLVIAQKAEGSREWGRKLLLRKLMGEWIWILEAR